MPTALEALDRQTGGLAVPDRELDLDDVGVDLGSLVLRHARAAKGRTRATADVDDAVLSADLERSITGASTLTVVVHDPARTLLDSDLFDRAVDVTVDRTVFRLAAVEKAGDSVTLTFEDRVVAWLRAHDRPRKASRATVTRAEFARSLVREVTVARIPFIAPELHVRQPIGKQKDRPSKRARDSRRDRGLSESARITVKGRRASKEQRRVLEAVLDVGVSVKAGPKLMVAAIMVVIVESAAQNLSAKRSDPTPGTSSVGAFQQQNMAPWNRRDRRDVAAAARTFYEVAKSVNTPRMSADEVAWRVQRPREDLRGEYAKRRKEADAIVAAYGGGDSDDSGAGSVRKRYEFTRGEPGRREDSWACLQRLADEVRWRCFVDRGRVYFLDDATLLRSRPRAAFSESHRAVDSIDYSLRPGAKHGPAQATVTLRAGRWDVAPGTAVTLEDSGPADGRWVVESVRRSLFDTRAEVALRRPERERPEPAAEQVARRGGTQGDSGSGSGSKRERIVAEAKRSLSTRTKHNYYLAGGQQVASQLANPTPRPPYRSDCSQWVHAIYRRAGLPSPGLTTYAQAAKGKRTSRPRPGDIMLTGNKGHCELYIGGGKTIGHGSAPIDVGPPLSYWARFGGHFFVTFDFLD